MIILEKIDTEFGHIEIVKSKDDGTCTYYQDICSHSQINADGFSTCGYVHVMCSIIQQSQAKKVLMIGCAGGTLATMLHRLGCEVTVVDINPHAFKLAKKYFHMPDEIQCVVEDGCSYLRKNDKLYDAIAIDVFSNDATIPIQFTTESFFKELKKALTPCGVVVMNVMVAHNMDMLADQIALQMEASKIPAILFDQPGKLDRNVIIAGGTVDNVRILPGRKATEIRHKLYGIIRRRPRKLDT